MTSNSIIHTDQDIEEYKRKLLQIAGIAGVGVVLSVIEGISGASSDAKNDLIHWFDSLQ